jgi:hypothetical protein
MVFWSRTNDDVVSGLGEVIQEESIRNESCGEGSYITASPYPIGISTG